MAPHPPPSYLYLWASSQYGILDFILAASAIYFAANIYFMVILVDVHRVAW